MKKLALLVAAFLLAAPLAAAPAAYFHFTLSVATVSGDYDENNVFVPTSFTVYGSYAGMSHQINRVFCPAGGCPALVGSNCVDAEGDVLDGGFFQADSVVVVARANCF